MGYFGPYFMILVQPTSKVVFNALKSVTTFDLISYDHQSPYVNSRLQALRLIHEPDIWDFDKKILLFTGMESIIKISTNY